MQKRKIQPLNIRIQMNILIFLLKVFFKAESYLLKIKHINYPKGQFILSLWHCHQCLVHGVHDKSNFYVLVSASNDGEVVAKAIEILNIKSIRGSSKRHGASAALEMIDKLKEGGNAAIMVDGPRGPLKKVKDGIIDISKLSGVPIVPVIWASKDKTFLKFNSWDLFRVPFGPCNTIALYGDPIYIPSDASKEDIKLWSRKLEEEMIRLEDDLDENYEIYKNFKEDI